MAPPDVELKRDRIYSYFVCPLLVAFAASVERGRAFRVRGRVNRSVSLTAAGGQPPPDTETLLRSPLEQQRFRRDVRLQAVGFTSLAAAALLGLFGLSAGLSMLH
jgi:hypothetical protein